MAFGVVGVPSALTVSPAGLGPAVMADIKAKLRSPPRRARARNLDVGAQCTVTVRFSPPVLLNGACVKTSTLTVPGTAPTVTVGLRGSAT